MDGPAGDTRLTAQQLNLVSLKTSSSTARIRWIQTVIVGLLSLMLQRNIQTRAFLFSPNQTQSGDYTAPCTQIKELNYHLTSAVYRLNKCSRTRAAGSSCLSSSRVNEDPNYHGVNEAEMGGSDVFAFWIPSLHFDTSFR